MAVSPKFNVRFQRGDSAFNQLLGQFIGIRSKENKERYAMQLRAADPSAKLKLVRDLIQDKNRIIRDMVKARQGVSVTTRTGGSRSSNRDAILQKRRNEAKVADYRKGEDAFNNAEERGVIKQAGEDLAGVLNRLKKTAIEENRALTKSEFDEAQKARETFIRTVEVQVNKIRSRFSAEKADGLINKIGQFAKGFATGQPEIERQVEEVLENVEPPPEIREIYAAGGDLTQSQKELYGSGIGGGGSKTVTQRGMAPSKEAEEMFAAQIELLDAQIKKATEDYQQAETEFKALLRGPQVNMALAPVARRPTRFTEIVEDFGRLNRVDPSFARDVLAAGEERGRFEGPKPYEELLSVRGAAGKSPFDFVLEQSDMIFKMSPDLGMGRQLTDSDARMILSNVGRMAKTVESPMFDDAQFGKMSFDNKQYGFSTGLSTLKEIATRALNDPKEDERIAAANYVADTLQSWEGSLSKEQIESASRASKPTAVISGFIKEATDAYDQFLETRNASNYRKALSDSYNKVIATEPEIRGLVGDAFLNEIERYSAVPESQRLPEELNFKLLGLKDTADELAARNMLTLPDLPEMEMKERASGLGREMEVPDFEAEMGD